MKEITSAQLLAGSLNHQVMPRVPCICPGDMMNMMTAELMELAQVWWPQAHTDGNLMATLAEAAYTAGIFDNIGVPFCMTVEAEAMGSSVDLGDRLTEPRVIGYAASSVEQWEQIQELSLENGRIPAVLQAIKKIKQDCPDAAVMGNLTGPISLASSLVDASGFYKDLRKKTEAAKKVMERVTEGLLCLGKAQIAAGADFITISDPSGTGEILGPRLFEQYALPALNTLCSQLKPLCKGVIVHICGQLKSIYPQLQQLQCSALSVDAVVNLKQLRREVPGKVIMGNVSTFALAAGKQDTIQALCNSCIANGSDILAPTCGLGTTTTIDSIRIMMETAGFDVYDLGRDVAVEDFVGKVKEIGGGIVCMSTLMTTTMSNMQRIIEGLQAAGIRDKVKVMIGGGPLSQSYADKIGADAYTSNVAEAAKKTQELAQRLA